MAPPDGLVFGVVGDPAETNGSAVARKGRDLTISWCRYGYRDRIVEGSSVDDVLRVSAAEGYRACFVQFHGHVLHERWAPNDAARPDLSAAMEALLGGERFLVAGCLVEERDGWWALDERCLLVDLETYGDLGAPRFGARNAGPVLAQLPRVVTRGDAMVGLESSAKTAVVRPCRGGWNLIAASLQSGLTVPVLPGEVIAHSISLELSSEERAEALGRYLGAGIGRFTDAPDATGTGEPALGDEQRELLRVIARQTANARKGVFVWNIESYEDIEDLASSFDGPVSTLYSVAAGFKPNRILATHGVDADTRVVFFDYSRPALDVRRFMIERWDGEDLPRFLPEIVRAFPAPDTFYHLWGDLQPDAIDPAQVERRWAGELARWGGAQAFAEHWRRHRQLEHRFVHCDLMDEPSRVLASGVADDRAVIWWSNAFFTMLGNWFFTIDERRLAYRRWVDVMADANSELLLYGSDYNNSCVNGIRADAYRRLFLERDEGCLRPCRINVREIRM